MGLFKDIGNFVQKKVFKPVEKAVLKPVKEAVIDPVAEHVIDPVVDAVDTHVVKPVVDPAIKAVGDHVVKPIGEHVVEPVVGAVGEHVVDPIADHIVNPIREQVDYDFAIRDELKAYDAALAQFRKTYAVFAEDWSNYLTAQIEHERLSEEFEPFRQTHQGHGGGQQLTTPIADRLREDTTFIEFFEPSSLLDLVTGRKFITYFENIKDHQADLERATKDMKAATRHVKQQSKDARQETARLTTRSAELRAEFGTDGSVSAQLLADTKEAAQIDMAQRLSAQGLDAEAIAEMTGWSADFITHALRTPADAPEA